LAVGVVQVTSLDVDDVVVVGEFASFSTEAQVGDGGKFDLLECEAGRPLVWFVGVLDGKGFFMVVGDLKFGGSRVVSDISSLYNGQCDSVKVEKRRYRTARHNFISLSILSFVIGSVSIADHAHNIRKDESRPIIFIRVNENTETFKPVL
jgi:hypothetical protein